MVRVGKTADTEDILCRFYQNSCHGQRQYSNHIYLHIWAIFKSIWWSVWVNTPQKSTRNAQHLHQNMCRIKCTHQLDALELGFWPTSLYVPLVSSLQLRTQPTHCSLTNKLCYISHLEEFLE